MINRYRDGVLGRLRRHHYLLINGGGLVITLTVLLASGLEIWASIRGYQARVQDEISLDVAQLSALENRTATTIRSGVQNIELALSSQAPPDSVFLQRFWASGASSLIQATPDYQPVLVMANKSVQHLEYAWPYISLAQQISPVISKVKERNEGKLSVYLYSADRNFLLASVAPWTDNTWRKLQSQRDSGLMEQLSGPVEQVIAANNEVHRTAKPILHWLPPYESPLSGQPVFHVATTIWGAKDVRFGVMVFELPVETLSALLPASSSGGNCLLLDRNGRLMVPCNNLSAGRLLSLAQEAQKQGLGENRRSFYQNGQFLNGWKLGPSGWVLVYSLSWGEIVAGTKQQILVSALSAVFIILITWFLLLLVKRRVLAPAVQQSEQIFESEQLSRTLIETAPLGLGLLAQASGEPLLRSPAMLKMQERLHTEGSSLPAELARYYRQQALPEGEQLYQELTFDAHSGKPVSLSVSMAPVRYHGEDALVVAFIDISNQKQLEQQLTAAREAADRASAAKSSFLAAMSHEIRTPLNAILGNLELLAHSAHDGQRERLNIIRQASDSLLATISDVLDFSKIEAGELYLEHIEFDVVEVAAHVLAIFAPVAQAKGLALVGELGDTVSQPMRGDPTCLRQVLNNLLSNALKFTEQGQVLLRIGVDEPASLIKIEVEDTGIGMSLSQQERVFRAFRQADETINRRYGGTGLGLALCTRLAQAMGGELSVTSELGKGSVFQLSLPLSQEVGAAERPLFQGERVCVLAAMPGARAYLSNVLTAWGLEVSVYQHPVQIDDATLDTTGTLVLWGDRATWHPEDENRLVEEAAWVVDCSNDGAEIPVATGRVLSTSVYGLKGLAFALRYTLQGERLPAREQGEAALPGALRVLVAEDNPVNRRLFEEQLKLLGCTVSLVEEGEQALASLERERFDILLTDLSMPGMDGYTLARRVRVAWPSMPVVAVTANATQQEYDECEAAGIVRVLTKPLLLDELKEMLLTVCGLDAVYHDVQIQPKGEVVSSGFLNGKALPEDVQRLFEKSCADSLAAIKQACMTEDATVILRELHSLSGAFGVFEMNEWVRQASDVENQVRNSGVKAASQALVLFCQALETVASGKHTGTEALIARIITLASLCSEEKVGAEITRLGNQLLTALAERR
jgi:two-component system capsular synthesis sensor histidine kinase RcsC